MTPADRHDCAADERATNLDENAIGLACFIAVFWPAALISRRAVLIQVQSAHSLGLRRLPPAMLSISPHFHYCRAPYAGI